jgi:hypothetical protein
MFMAGSPSLASSITFWAPNTYIEGSNHNNNFIIVSEQYMDPEGQWFPGTSLTTSLHCSWAIASVI